MLTERTDISRGGVIADLAPDQRNYFYLLAAGRVDVHKLILYALRIVHASSELTDDEKGLGLTPVNQVKQSKLNTFSKQIQYAENIIRSLTNE